MESTLVDIKRMVYYLKATSKWDCLKIKFFYSFKDKDYFVDGYKIKAQIIKNNGHYRYHLSYVSKKDLFLVVTDEISEATYNHLSTYFRLSDEDRNTFNF